jgi:molybdopterin synthase sulfur carrier subunit
LFISKETMPTIFIPTPMRTFTKGKARVQLSLARGTIPQLLSNLDELCPGIREQIYDETGAIKRYLTIFVNSRYMRSLEDLKTVVEDKDEVFIIAAMAGG